MLGFVFFVFFGVTAVLGLMGLVIMVQKALARRKEREMLMVMTRRGGRVVVESVPKSKTSW